MKKSMVKTLIIGIIAGISCGIAPQGSYNNIPVAIFQQPFNNAIFYLMFFIIQTDFFCEPLIYDIRFKTLFHAKLWRFSREERCSALYIAVYFLASCAVSILISADYFKRCFNCFSVINWLISAVLNLSILNLLSVNLNYLIKKNTIIIIEAAIILGGLAMCFAAPRLAPYACIWFYGVYPKPFAKPFIWLLVYLIWTVGALIIGFIPIKEMRKERQ